MPLLDEQTISICCIYQTQPVIYRRSRPAALPNFGVPCRVVFAFNKRGVMVVLVTAPFWFTRVLTCAFIHLFLKTERTHFQVFYSIFDILKLGITVLWKAVVLGTIICYNYQKQLFALEGDTMSFCKLPSNSEQLLTELVQAENPLRYCAADLNELPKRRTMNSAVFSENFDCMDM